MTDSKNVSPLYYFAGLAMQTMIARNLKQGCIRSKTEISEDALDYAIEMVTALWQYEKDAEELDDESRKDDRHATRMAVSLV